MPILLGRVRTRQIEQTGLSTKCVHGCLPAQSPGFSHLNNLKQVSGVNDEITVLGK